MFFLHKTQPDIFYALANSLLKEISQWNPIESHNGGEDERNIRKILNPGERILRLILDNPGKLLGKVHKRSQ